MNDSRRLRCGRCGDTSALYGPVGLGEMHEQCGGFYSIVDLREEREQAIRAATLSDGDVPRLQETLDRGCNITRSDGYALINVLWRGGDSYLCGTCQGTDRYRNAERKGCEHCQRIARYREDHP